jgi:hypothetical protein
MEEAVASIGPAFIGGSAQTAGIVFEGFAIGQTCSAAIACVKEQRAEIPERAHVRAIALDGGNICIARLIVAPEHLEHRRPREQQRDIIGALDEPLLDFAKILSITKRVYRGRQHRSPR